MQNQNQFQNAGPPPPPMNNMNMNQPQNQGKQPAAHHNYGLDAQLPYLAEGMRQSARVCAILQLIFSILSFMVGMIVVILVAKLDKPGADMPLTYNCLLPILEFTAALIWACGTNRSNAAGNPVGSLSKTITWIMLAIIIIYARFFFVDTRLVFYLDDSTYLLCSWYLINLGFHIIYLGVGVTYAFAIYEVSRNRIAAAPGNMAVAPAPMPMMPQQPQPPPNWGPPPGPLPMPSSSSDFKP